MKATVRGHRVLYTRLRAIQIVGGEKERVGDGHIAVVIAEQKRNEASRLAASLQGDASAHLSSRQRLHLHARLRGNQGNDFPIAKESRLAIAGVIDRHPRGTHRVPTDELKFCKRQITVQ